MWAPHPSSALPFSYPCQPNASREPCLLPHFHSLLHHPIWLCHPSSTKPVPQRSPTTSTWWNPKDAFVLLLNFSDVINAVGHMLSFWLYFLLSNSLTIHPPGFPWSGHTLLVFFSGYVCSPSSRIPQDLGGAPNFSMFPPLQPISLPVPSPICMHLLTLFHQSNIFWVSGYFLVGCWDLS